jgi:hypothetical protein
MQVETGGCGDRGVNFLRLLSIEIEEPVVVRNKVVSAHMQGNGDCFVKRKVPGYAVLRKLGAFAIDW